MNNICLKYQSKRTKFNKSIVVYLNKKFKINPRPNKDAIKQLAFRTSLSSNQVKSWFLNKIKHTYTNGIQYWIKEINQNYEIVTANQQYHQGAIFNENDAKKIIEANANCGTFEVIGFESALID